MIEFYLFFALLASVISFVALYQENEKAGLFFNDWLSVIFIGALWPIFFVIFFYDIYAKHRLKKGQDPKSDKCGCGCEKKAEE